MFASLKVAWRQAVYDYQVKHPERVISKHNFSSIFSEAWLRSMTSINVLSGFRTTGVYPLNRDAIELPGEDVVLNLCQKTGISYIPLYTPVKRRISEISVASPSYTPEELLEFEHCFDDRRACDNPRYRLWLETYRPEEPLLYESPLLSWYRPAEKHGSLSPFLTLPDAPRPKPKDQPHSSRVLTSFENLKTLEEKEIQKQEKIRPKEERKKKTRIKETAEGAI